ncbi:MAG: hypothetical protein ACLFMO_02240, partial [Eubacteriales bacterium]
MYRRIKERENEVNEGSGKVTSLDQAYSTMTDYINGVDVNQEQLNASLKYASTYGKITEIGSLKSLSNGSQDYNRYDMEILAWTNYWNETLKDKRGFTAISANTVKVMMYTESKIGYYHGSDSANGSIDVMQVLDNRNSAIQRLAAEGYFDPNEGAAYGLPRGGYGLYKKLYIGGSYDNSYATINMSISAGVGWLGYKQALRGSESLGVTAYNGGGDPNYWSKIKDILDNHIN